MTQRFIAPECCGKYLKLISDWKGTYTFQCNRCSDIIITNVCELKRAQSSGNVSGSKDE